TQVLPSAFVTHGNTPIAEDKVRSSIVFFMLSGLARWFQNGYMSDKEFNVQSARIARAA
ncbi:hypothetical protein BDP27DRAFT_1236680, partial [Rhodocollybia butyracea]